MDLAWNPLGAVGLVVGLLSCALGALVWMARADRAQNALLALFAFLSGLYFVTFNGIRLFVADPVDSYALMIAGSAAVIMMHAIQIVFVGTLDSPVVAWIRRPFARVAIVGVFGAIVLHLIFWPRVWIVDVAPLDGFSGWAAVQGAPRALYLLGMTFVLILLAFPAVHAWRRARTPVARRQTRIFAITFGATAVSWAAFIAWYLSTVSAAEVSPRATVMIFLWQAANSFAFTVGVVYGILKAQLFDIDLKLKWTIRKGTLAASFVGVFFVVSEGAQSLFSARIGPVAGLLAAGALVFALSPLQRVAERVADKALPHATGDAAYTEFRKMQVYSDALEEMLADGTLTDKDRAVLARLRSRLLIGDDVAARLEADARAARAGVA